MLGSTECLRRAAEMERQAQRASDEVIKAEFLKVAEGWRALAEQAAERERNEENG